MYLSRIQHLLFQTIFTKTIIIIFLFILDNKLQSIEGYIYIKKIKGGRILQWVAEFSKHYISWYELISDPYQLR